MIGSLVLAVQLRPGVQTTSSPRLGTVSGGEGVVDSAVLLLQMVGNLVQDVLPKPGVPMTSNPDQEIVHGVAGSAKRVTSVLVGEYLST